MLIIITIENEIIVVAVPVIHKITIVEIRKIGIDQITISKTEIIVILLVIGIMKSPKDATTTPKTVYITTKTITKNSTPVSAMTPADSLPLTPRVK